MNTRKEKERMKMSDVFNRYEKKYKLDHHQYCCVIDAIKENMSHAYSTINHKQSMYTIKNIYYDTFDDQLIKHSLNKPVFKEKLRLRGYGNVSNDSIVYLEIKKKYKGFVNKRRTSIKLSDAYEFIRTGTLPDYQNYHNKQVLKEIEYFLSQKLLIPKVYIKYDRQAFEEDDLRITFDTSIASNRDSVLLTNKAADSKLLADEYYLMEVKSAKAMPLWLVEMLSSKQIYPSSFSKYGTDFLQQHTIQNLKKGSKLAC
jgi:SPX domain protein involved in polyphosphate accumulation